jgi:hypothetical protein
MWLQPMRFFPHSIFLIVLLVLFWCVSRALFFIPDGSIATIFPSVWGDWSLHIAHSWWFAEQSPANWLDPRILRFDETFSYPPLINFMSGMLLRAGFGIQAAMLMPCMLFAVMLGSGLNMLYRNAGAKPWVAGILPLVLLLAGGTRTLATLSSWMAQKSGLVGEPAAPLLVSLFEDLQRPLNEGLLSQVWLTPLFTLIIPQRTFLAGLGLGSVSLLILLNSGRRNPSMRPLPAMLSLAILMPLLAVAHVHSWLAVLCVLAVLVAMDSWMSPSASIKILRHWMRLTGPGLALSLVMISLTIPAISGKVSGFAWSPGWMMNEARQSLPLFWLVNWNVIIPLVIIAAVASSDFRRDPCFIAGTIIFVAMNVVKLQPWSWDNSKLLFWSMLLFSLPLARFFSRIRSRIIATGAILFCCVDGMAILGQRVIQPRDPMVIWTATDQVIAAWARQKLPVDALILSPSHVDHRYWSFALTGRKNVQAYGGWLWTHGLPIEPMKSRMTLMIEKPAENLAAMKGMGITHIALPETAGSLKIGYPELNQSFKLLVSFDNQAIFTIP